MLKTYRIIPLVFILFLFGFTLFTVSPVIAEDSPEFVACQQIKPSGDFRLMKQKKNCFRDVARLYQVASVNSAVTPSDPSGGEVAELNAKISGLEARLGEVAQLNAKISGLETENARLLAMQTAPADPSGDEKMIARLKAALKGMAVGHCDDVLKWRRARAAPGMLASSVPYGSADNYTPHEKKEWERCVKFNQLF